jgi:predicted Zn-dependent protease
MDAFTLLGSKWPDDHITWSFATQTFSEDTKVPFTGAIAVEWQHLVEQAFARWAGVSGLTFEEVPDSADRAHAPDIRIGWGTFGATANKIGETMFRHDSGTILPDIVVRLEDPAERPLIFNALGQPVYSGTSSDLYALALHEIGHSLGIDHSLTPGSIMNPNITYGAHDLGQSDIDAIRTLYASTASLQYSVTNNYTAAHSYITGLPYSGTVGHLQYQYLGTATGDIVGGTPFEDFINTLGGDDAVDGGLGNDVLDGGTNSNFLTGGSGIDVFFLDGRGNQPTWGTITDWQSGEELCLWGWHPGLSTARWIEMDGLGKYRGATLHADLDGNGTIDTSVTWTGLTHAQLPMPVELDGLLWFK